MSSPDLPQVFPAAKQAIYGEGPVPCDYLILAQAPGYFENSSGRSLVGPDGRFLNKLLEQFSEIRRAGVYCTNVVKHHPPGSRAPLVGEVKPYRAYLHWEIAQVQPKVIITLGAVALREFDKSLRVKTEHGRARLAAIDGVWEGVLVPWYMPAAAIKDANVVGLMIEDAQRLAQEVANVRVEVAPANYWLTEAPDDVAHMLLAQWGEFGFDTETTSPVRAGVFATDEAEMVGYSVSTASRTGVYVPSSFCGEAFAGILGSPLWNKVCHNVKFEYKVVRRDGVALVGFEDTKLAAYLLGHANTGLKDLARQMLGEQPERIKDLWPEGIANQPKAVATQRYKDNYTYAAADADNTLRLWAKLKPKLVAKGLWSVYQMEKALVPVLADMEARGMAVSELQCRRTANELRWHRVKAGQAAVGELINTGVDIRRFNVRSGDQLAELLDRLDAPLRKRTEVKKRLVVDATALEGIRSWWPDFIGPLLDERKLAKMGSYVDSFLALRGPDGRLHTSFNQSGHWEEGTDDPKSSPSTGRLSSSGPNLMNIPHHRARIGGIDWAGPIRGCLRPTEGWLLMSVDLGQEEPRIIAVTAQDKLLLESFAYGRDIYRPATEALYATTGYVSSMEDCVWAVKYDQERFFGKQFFLAWYYGAGAGRLKALDKSLTPTAIADGLELLANAHPARQRYLDDTFRILHEHGFVESLYGRKRWLPKIWAANKGDREAALREAANARIQMTAADILKIAMPKIDRQLVDQGLEGRLVSTVHDEVVLEMPPSEVTAVKRIVEQAFNGLLEGLPLIVEAKVGADWGRMERI